MRINRFLLFLGICLFLLRNGMIVFDLWTPLEGGDLPEGLIHGNLAFDLLDGSWRGWPTYLYKTSGHLGNEIIVSLIAIPLYVIFGNSLLVLSQVGILYSIGILVLIYSLCKSYISEGVARIASILFVCLPPVVQGWTIYPYGLHLESALYSLIGILLFLKLQEAKSAKRSLVLAIGLGLVSGIGIFHSEVYLLTLACVMFFWFVRDRVFFIRKDFLFFFVSLLIGLIPYFYFDNELFIYFINRVFSGGFSFTHTSGRAVNNYKTALSMISILFWPIKTLFLGKIPSIGVSALGLCSIVALSVVSLRSRLKPHFLWLMILYSLGYIGVCLFAKVAIMYYVFPALPHTGILIAILAHRIWKTSVFRQRVMSRLAVLCFLVICLANVYPIIEEFKWRKSISQFQKQMIIRGHCFFYPREYSIYDGYKTPITKEVERVAIRGKFVEINHSGPRKSIFISRTRKGIFPLDTKKSYLFYGTDASFRGIRSLSAEIREDVPVEYQENAFKSLAVFFMTDFLLRDILNSVKNGDVERWVPEQYRKFFYYELGRKFRNSLSNRMDKFKLALKEFTGPERQLIENGWEDSRFFNARALL